MGGNLTEGMDTGRVKDVAGRLKQTAAKIGVVNSEGASTTGELASNWLGQDMQSWSDSWNDVSKTLQQAQTAMEQFAQKAESNAELQEQTSQG